MSDNLRQFSSIDSSDANLHGSLTNRPPSGAPAGDPIDFEALNRQVANQRTQQNYVYKESTAEYVLRREREIAAAQRIRQETADAKAANALQDQRNQNQRNELANRINNNTPTDPEVGTPKPESPLAQQQRSTPERQPMPSTGSPPPIVKSTAARANPLVEPTATPAPAALAEAVPVAAVGGVLSQIPRALPQAAGRLALPAIGGGIDFANRVVHGQSVGHAATSAVAGSVGAVAGFTIGTAIGGPLLGYALGAVGGMVAGSISDSFFHETPTTGVIAVQPQNYPPFYGGQEGGVRYVVRIRSISINPAIPPNDFDAYLWGGIGAPYTEGNDGYIDSHGEDWHLGGGYRPGGTKHYLNNDSGGGVRILSITRADGLPDTSYPPGPSAPPPDNLPYRYDPSPIGDDNTVPSGTPAAGTNKGKTRNVAPSLPSNNTPRGAPFFPGHGGLAPSYTPNPTQTPSNLGGLLPAVAPIKQPLAFAEPDDVAIPVSASGNASHIENGVVTSPPTSNAQPIPLNSSRVTVPSSSSPIPGRQNPTPDSVSPTPKASSSPSPKTPEEAQAQQQKKDFDEQLGKLTFIATAIAALTPAIQGIPDAIAKSPAVQAATGATVQGAVCEIAQPTGCLGAPIQRAEDAANANGNKLDQINAALGAGNAGANAALLAGQQTILERLGDQLPGGIGGKLSRFAEWMHLDRVLNIMIFATTIHNGLMLSNDIGQTLLGIINNALTLIGLKKEDGSGFDIGSLISDSIENLIKGAIGTENYQQLTTAWQKANRIYQATTNVLNQLMNVNSVITNALEVIGSYTGKIGNALRIWGVLGEKAYSWMNPQPSFDNKWITKLQQLQENANTVAMVAQIPVDTVSAVTELNNSATEFVKAIKQEPDTKSGIDPGEAAKVKEEREAAKAVSNPISFDISDLFDADD
ncbi:hypothetical protein [Nostoc sp.]|uniref:hypothetical protein n=1 Tax=Nostoc sp. TaxID=1180 RepID=UPI002FFBD310